MASKWPQVVAYARISPKKDESDITSIEAQFAYIVDYCNRNEYEVAGQYSDVCLSGDDVNRPGLWEAVGEVKRKGILVVFRLDRLARSVFLTEMVRKQLEKQGGKFETVQGLGKSESAEDKFICNILSAFAEYERTVINARTKYAMKRKQAGGLRMSLHAPFGCEPDPKDEKRWRLCAREQKVLGEIKRQRGLDRSLYEICRILTTLGMKPRAGTWNTTKMHRIVRRLDWERPLAPAGPGAETSGEAG